MQKSGAARVAPGLGLSRLASPRLLQVLRLPGLSACYPCLHKSVRISLHLALEASNRDFV